MRSNLKLVSTVAGAAALALMAGPALFAQVAGQFGSTAAYAQDSGHKDNHDGGSHDGGKKGGKGQGGDDSGTHGGGAGGKGKSMNPVYRGGQTPRATDEGGTGKRGPQYGGGGKQGGGGPTGKGDLFGDLFILQRNPDGTAVTEIVDGVTYVYLLKKDGTYLKVALDEKNNYVLSDADKLLVAEVELSRLNSVRSPKLLDQRYAEVLKLLNDPNVKTLTTDATGRIVITYLDGTTKTIDSPVDSLAIYVKLMENGYLPGLTIDPSKLTATLTALLPAATPTANYTAADLLIAASLIAAASDKSIPVTADAIIYLNRILGLTASSSTLPVITDVTGTYVDYATLVSTYTYDRSIYDVTVKVAINEGGTVVIKDVNLKTWLDTTSGTITSLSGMSAFLQATEDTRMVIEYIHDHQIPSSD